jgi:transcriptional regulator with XRE-family HTH domain
VAKKKPPPPAELLGDKIRSVITRRGLSANAVAVEAGIDPSVVSRFLARDRVLTLASAERIAAALGLTLTEGRGGLR